MTGRLASLIGLDRSFGQAIERGRDNNFDLLRLAAALAVLFGHSFVLAAGGKSLETVDPISRFLMQHAGFGEAINDLAVDVFFVISGFLVARSFFTQPNLVGFLAARLLRIFPAAIVCAAVTVIALAGLGTLPVADYLADPQTQKFLLNNATLWKVEYTLPGLFSGNPYPDAVNGSLWTLPIELRAYLYLSGLGIVGLLRWRHGANLVLAVLIVLFLVPDWSGLVTHNEDKWRLYLFFFVGSACYLNRRYIPIGIAPAVALLALYTATSAVPKLHALIFVLLVSYLTLAVALGSYYRALDPGRVGDFSYGVYLYAFPVQQALMHLLPASLNGWSLTLSAGVITLLFAAASWFAVERQALRWKGAAARVWARQPG